MSLPNWSPGQQPNPDNSPEKTILLGYKSMIYGMWVQLAPPADLRQINRGILDTFIQDLGTILADVQNMKNSMDLHAFFISVDAFCEKIGLDGLVELYAASTKLNEGDIHEYFRCLLRCSGYLQEALAQFRI